MSEPIGRRIARLRNEMSTLERRLTDGYELIDTRKAQGDDVTELEDFWISLLHEYEATCDELNAHE